MFAKVKLRLHVSWRMDWLKRVEMLQDQLLQLGRINFLALATFWQQMQDQQRSERTWPQVCPQHPRTFPKPGAESLDTRTAPPKQQVPYLWPSPFQMSEQLCVENLLFWGHIFFKKADPSWKISNKFDWVGKGHSPGRCNQSCMVCLQSCFIGQTSTLCLRRKLLPLFWKSRTSTLKKFEGRGLDFLTEESTQTQESDPRLR